MSLRSTLKIMVVDDMATSRGILMAALKEIGFKKISYQTSGDEALGTLKEAPVHLVISDYNMPGRTGLEFLAEIRANPDTAKIGFILVTGSEAGDLVGEGRKLGLNNFLRKPVTPEGLRDCIEQVVGPF